MTPSVDIESLRARLADAGQGHLLRFLGTLTGSDSASLIRQCTALPLDLVAREAAALRQGAHAASLGGAGADASAGGAKLEPAEVISQHAPDWPAFQRAGEQLLRDGAVACFTVAGGQGTRLGWDAPKGTFPSTPIRQASLFQVFAEAIRGLRHRFSAPLDWIVMTSPQNDEATRAFFQAHNFFHLGAETVRFVVQGTMPALGLDGRILLASEGEVATSPDGHGGSIRALAESGELRRLRAAGVKHLSYFQVDNPLAHPADPLFLGIHATHPSSGGHMSSRSVRRAGPGEKVGVFCRRGDRTEVVEYSDLPASLAHATLDDGNLLHSAGNIAVHALSLDFIDSLTRGGLALPFHHALKKVPCLDEEGRLHEPTAPNAVKLETFIFDALPLASRPVVVDTSRSECFAPIKNATGADSATSSRAAQVARAAAWLESAGVAIPRDAEGEPECLLEIAGDVALTAEELRDAACIGRVRLPRAVERGGRLLVTLGD